MSRQGIYWKSHSVAQFPRKTVKLSSMKRACVFKLTDSLFNLDEKYFKIPDQKLLNPQKASTHPPRILMLYGSLRERSYSKLLTLEAASLLEAMGQRSRFLIRWICRNLTLHLTHIPR